MTGGAILIGLSAPKQRSHCLVAAGTSCLAAAQAVAGSQLAMARPDDRAGVDPLARFYRRGMAPAEVELRAVRSSGGGGGGATAATAATSMMVVDSAAAAAATPAGGGGDGAGQLPRPQQVPAFRRGGGGGGFAAAAAPDVDSSDDELPVDDGRTPGRRAGWKDGLTDEERNDLFLYDPRADDEDEKWVVEHVKHASMVAAHAAASGDGSSGSSRATLPLGAAERAAAHAATAQAQANSAPISGPAPTTRGGEGADGMDDETAQKRQQEEEARKVEMPASDAVLNCPGCFTLICLDCQRHAHFHNQWRAVRRTAPYCLSTSLHIGRVTGVGTAFTRAGGRQHPPRVSGAVHSQLTSAHRVGRCSRRM
jgi:hypothetical protein